MERALVRESDECIPWPFGLNNSGYGHITVEGDSTGVHRYACERTHGAPPTPHHEAAHSCNVRSCINGRHLRWATKLENEADTLVHGTRALGESHGQSILTRDQVIEIRALAGKMFQRDIAARFGVAPNTISQVVTGRNWGWLP